MACRDTIKLSVPFAVLVSVCLRPLLQLLLLQMHGHNILCNDHILMQDNTIKQRLEQAVMRHMPSKSATEVCMPSYSHSQYAEAAAAFMHANWRRTSHS